MGFLKNEMIQREQRGYRWIGDDKFVCEGCLSDIDLRAFVRANLDPDTGSTRCSYCDRSADDAVAIPIDSLLKEIADAVFSEYEHADGSLFDSETSDWIMPTFDSDELFRYHLDEYPFENEELAGEIIGAFVVDPWCERDPLWLGPGEALLAGWHSFAEQVKHVTRYLFFAHQETPFEEGVPPGKILARIREFVDDHDLVGELEAGKRLVRARHSLDLSPLSTVKELGAPTAEQAKTSSRMSAAGIPVFYGALERETAVAETLAHVSAGGDGSAVQVSWGSFETKELLLVLDLRRVPEVPGLFSPRRNQRPSTRFLRTFAAEVAKPIPIDGNEHIEYVPTQVVAEFFRHVYRTPAGERLDGMLYPSSAQEGGTSCVLFFDAENCCLLEEGWREDRNCTLALDPSSVGSSRF